MTNNTNLPPFMESEFNPFKKFKFPEFNMDTFLSSYQRNLELMNTTLKIATETSQSLIELQNKYLKKSINQWNDEVKYNFSKAPLNEKTTHQTELVKSSVEEVIKHAQDVTSILEKSNEKIMESLKKSFKEGQDEISDIVNAKKNTKKYDNKPDRN